jgi:hypothetical protein
MAGGAGAEVGRTWSGRLLGDAGVNLDLRPAWRRNDPEIEHEAVEFWTRMANLPADVSAEKRARELAAVAYRDGRLVGVATAVIAPVEALRCKFAFYRCAVAEEERRSLASTALTVFTRDLIERWSAENPDEGVLGLAAIIESSALQQRQRDPLWTNSGLNLVAFTSKGKQLRVAWFRHARVPVG